MYTKKKACFSYIFFCYFDIRDWHNLRQYRLASNSDSFCPVDLIIEITYSIFFATTGCSCLCSMVFSKTSLVQRLPHTVITCFFINSGGSSTLQTTVKFNILHQNFFGFLISLFRYIILNTLCLKSRLFFKFFGAFFP